MKKPCSLLILLFFFIPAFASHIVGGEMTYEYLKAGSAPNTSQYRLTLKLFRDEHCTNCAQMPADVYIGIFNNDNNNQFPGSNQPYDVVKATEVQLPVVGFPTCITNPPDLDYHMATYIVTVELPDNLNGYTAAYQTCCRVAPLANVHNPVGASGSGTGSTYACRIPGTSQLGSEHNSSPQFATALSIICAGKPFTLDFSATDSDGDVLTYYFCDAYNGGATTNSANVNPAPPSSATPPQYGSVQYINNFTGSQPLGSSVSINSTTGKISGIGPSVGEYVISVCVNEYRNGKQIGYHRKDFIVNVDDCDFAGAQLAPDYLTCDQFTYTFKNENNSPQNRSYFWDAGVAGTSNSPVATFQFPDTGVYNVKLVVNRGDPCSDSTNTQVKVYPGFFPNFTFSGICINQATQFTDSTVAKYGTVNAWSWDFGDPSTINDVSNIQNPTYTYPQNQTFNVRLIASSSKGCSDTVYKDVTLIDKPLIDVRFRDTLICNGDLLQLEAIGNGTFSWTPVTNIENPNTATPTVKPAVTTKYYVQLNDHGCLNNDSVQVRVVDFVTLKAPADTTICTTDSVRLAAVSNGLHFVWDNPSTLSNPNILNPMAAPPVTTTYQITATIGGCTATDDVVIKTVPYPKANAGSDTAVCFGTPAQLYGTLQAGTFVWTPSATLTNSNTLHPIARPARTTAYILTASDTLGCPKPGRDTVLVTVLPKIQAFAGRDTAVVVGQPLQFMASGGNGYLWLPATSLNKNDIPDPIGVYDGSFGSIRYKVIITNSYDQAKCVDSATVLVKIFRTGPRIFVPSAFTPNGDKLNDFFRPIAVGMTRIDYFRVYNRWGQLVFSTTVNGHGWDGKIGGKEQGTNTYVWVVKGIDYTGKPFFAKGTVTLIR